MLPAVIRTSFPVFWVIFRLWKYSCSTRINKSPPLALSLCWNHRGIIAAVLIRNHLHILKYRRHSETVVLFSLVYNINKGKGGEGKTVFISVGAHESHIGHIPGPYGPSALSSCAIYSPHYPLLILKL